MHILTDALHRIAYSTDASAYREMPMGVAYPKTEDDIRELMEEARKRKTHLIPRAGGTSIAGQVVGSGIVVDVSRYMNRILEINAGERWVRVQPGVVRDELNIALKPYGLFFSPETSTSNRCCIGGMVGNNSCGTHSLIYGSTRHHVIGIKGLLSDGSTFEIKNYELRIDSELGERIVTQLAGWKNDEQVQKLLKENFPDISLRRRSCGYAIDEAVGNDELIASLNDELMASLSDGLIKLIVGSEGTLCFVTEITLNLDPLPPAHKMVVCKMLDDLNEAWSANLCALKQKPVAVELIDGKILELAKGNLSAEKNMEVLGLDKDHLPAGILVSEFWAETIDELRKKAEKYADDLCLTDTQHKIRPSVDRREGLGFLPIKMLFDSDVEKVWNLRKAGLGVLTGAEGDAKPVGVIEDTAVAPERLGAYMADFQEMMKRLDLDCVYYGHISTGELHLRPILNLKDAGDRKKFRQVAEETAKLVKKHKGSLSGEHGDGRLRGEFIPLMYGNEVYELFRQLKQTWDPDGILNVGKIVDTPPMDQWLRYDNVNDELNRPKGLNDELTDLMRRIERCNGSGDCRKSNLMGGTMCPTYKVSGDELWTTRARANVLREKLTNDPNALTSKEVAEVLDSCLSCKGCKSECPSNVDMTRLRSEVLQMKYDQTGTPFRSWLVARMAVVERLGSVVPHIYNWFARTRWTSAIVKYIVRFAAERQIPSLSRHSMRWLVAHSVPKTTIPTKGKIYLFADEFTNYQEAELGLKFAELITALGYEVEIPKHVESGRAAISKGCLHLAAKYARKNVQLLAPIVSDETPLVGIEPSCILSFRDEYPRLVGNGGLKRPNGLNDGLMKNCLLYDEWLMREIGKGNISANDFASLRGTDIWLHGHCHQKALVGVEKTAECLQLTGAEVHVIPSGCCGMAGSYGYEKEHYKTSMEIGEMVLFPAVRESQKTKDERQKTVVCAPGTSCRQQILDGTGVKALHPIEVLWQAVKK
ncbi:MAG: FAD-binding protein [Paludibacteraceae bacterium]|nr:FAD-binding protein [Paludibacteraceae bacterium]